MTRSSPRDRRRTGCACDLGIVEAFEHGGFKGQAKPYGRHGMNRKVKRVRSHRQCKASGPW
jgi:hypothetical protein